MNAYMYQTALLCEDCGTKVQRWARLQAGPDWKNVLPVNSYIYPQGPYPNGGGEADCPQHCDHCGLFLENPLTADGYEYVRKAVRDCVNSLHPNLTAFNVWAPFYL
jgi:hypothetical protein